MLLAPLPLITINAINCLPLITFIDAKNGAKVCDIFRSSKSMGGIQTLKCDIIVFKVNS